MENAMESAVENIEQAIRRTIESVERRIANHNVCIHRQRDVIAQRAKNGHAHSLREAQAELKIMLAQWDRMRAELEEARQRLLGPVEPFDQSAIDGAMNKVVQVYAP